MERRLVSIQTIEAIAPITGADNIEQARVMGWTVVVKKGEFVSGAPCVFFEIDSVLPDGPPWAEFMRKRYGWEFGLPAYAAASFVAYSRVEAGEHHPEDVAAGAAIGIISSYIFTRPFAGWLIQPDVDPRYYAIRLSRTWQ